MYDLAMRSILVAAMLLVLSAGCESVSIRVVDASTRQPLQGVPAQLWVKHGDLMDFLMGLPGESKVDAFGVTDTQGRVVFNKGDFEFINFRSDRTRSLPHLYRVNSQWYFQNDLGVGPAEVRGGDILVPLRPEQRQ